MVERDERTDAFAEQLVDEPVVEGEPGLVHRAAPVRYHPRPADREAIGVAPEIALECYVLAPAVVVVARNVAGLPGRDGSGLSAERVPDGWAFPIGVVAALDLVGGRRSSEKETAREPSGECDRIAHRGGSASGQSSPMRALIPPST